MTVLLSEESIAAERADMLGRRLACRLRDAVEGSPVTEYNGQYSVALRLAYSCASMKCVVGTALFLGIVAIVLFTTVSWAVPAEIMDVTIGMTMQEVMAIMGEPDRKAVLSGKILQDLAEISPDVARSNARIVFIYNKDNLQVWFRQGRVTGMTKDGVSVLRPKQP
jgi:hypothetical protein